MATMNVPNYGLLTGISQGVNSFLNAWQTEKGIQQKQNMAELAAGVQKDADGNLVYRPEKQAEINAKAAKAKYDIEGYEPGSASNQTENAYLSSLTGAKTPEDLTRPSREKAYGLLGGVYKADAGKDREGLVTDRIMDKTSATRERLGIQKDKLSSSAVDNIVKDPQLSGHVQRINGIDRILSQLDEAKSGKFVDTAQLLADANAEYSIALTGSNNAALGKLERTEYHSAASQLAGMIQTIKADPQSINSPKILEQITAQTKGLRSNYENAVKSRAELLKRNYKNNPDAAAAQEEKIQQIVGSYGGGSKTSGGYGDDVINYAKEHGISNEEALAVKTARGGK